MYNLVKGSYGEFIPNISNHLTLQDGSHLIKKDYNCFTIIRNPYERAVSYYHWFRETSIFKGSKNIDNTYLFKQYALDMTFEEWVVRRYSMDTIAQEEYIGESVLILKQESLKEDIKTILNPKFNLNLNPNKLLTLYKSNHGKFEDYIDKELETIIFLKEQYIFNNNFYSRLEL
jgi:hypothetical protein